MIKTKLFVQLPSVCTVIQYVYNYIHVHETFLQNNQKKKKRKKGWYNILQGLPRRTERLSAVSFCITITSLIQKQSMFYLLIPVASSFISKK